MRYPAYAVLSVAITLFTACSDPNKETLEKENRLLVQEVEQLKRQNSDLEKKLSELQETDQGYWERAQGEKGKGNWQEVVTLTEKLASRWPASPLAAKARELRGEARVAQAEDLLRRADQELKNGNSKAIASLQELVKSYPDTPAGRKAVAKLQTASEDLERRVVGSGKWRVSKEVSPVDDTTSVYLNLDADDTVRTQLNSSTPSLIVRCQEKKTEAYINWGVYLGIDETRVLVRLDDGKATESSWNISTDYKASFAPGGVAFVKRMLGHKQLLARVTPYGESPATVTFNIAGLDAAVEPLQKACGWR